MCLLSNRSQYFFFTNELWLPRQYFCREIAVHANKIYANTTKCFAGAGFIVVLRNWYEAVAVHRAGVITNYVSVWLHVKNNACPNTGWHVEQILRVLPVFQKVKITFLTANSKHYLTSIRIHVDSNRWSSFVSILIVIWCIHKLIWNVPSLLQLSHE